jgi:hypothetical protein
LQWTARSRRKAWRSPSQVTLTNLTNSVPSCAVTHPRLRGRDRRHRNSSAASANAEAWRSMTV